MFLTATGKLFRTHYHQTYYTTAISITLVVFTPKGVKNPKKTLGAGVKNTGQEKLTF